MHQHPRLAAARAGRHQNVVGGIIHHPGLRGVQFTEKLLEARVGQWPGDLRLPLGEVPSDEITVCQLEVVVHEGQGILQVLEPASGIFTYGMDLLHFSLVVVPQVAVILLGVLLPGVLLGALHVQALVDHHEAVLQVDDLDMMQIEQGLLDLLQGMVPTEHPAGQFLLQAQEGELDALLLLSLVALLGRFLGHLVQ